MKKLHLALVAPLAMLAACAGAPVASTGSTSGAAASGSQYCKKDRLATEGEALVCNWAASAAEACENTNIGTVRKGSVSSGPTNAGRCGNGQWLVTVTTR